jgi:GNAT superfamily N-acetyltransferase
MQIVPLDAADPAMMADWHATYHAGHVFGREYATPWMLEEMRADFLGNRTGERVLGYAGYDGALIVTIGLIWLPLKDNLTLGGVEVVTHPAHRDRGHGSQMLDHLTGVCRAEGRTVLSAEVSTPYDGPVDGHGHPGAEFLYRRGFRFSLGDVMRVLDLPADTALLERLASEAEPQHRDYTIRQFKGAVPDDIIEPFGRLIGSLVSEAPMGELRLETEVFDVERIRADEAVFAASGRTKYTTVAVERDGTVAAYSEVAVPRYDPGHVYQWGTLVLKEHRGHRLGLATKVHNLLWLQRQMSGPALLVTYNAEVNSHMIGVNTAMGFRPVERLGEFMRSLE